MKVLVTGATGFIGRSLVPHLRETGHEVVAVGRDAVTGQFVWNLEERLPTLPRGIDAIVHLAQSRAHRRFPDDAQRMFAINVAATHSLLDAAAASGVGQFCLVSSGTVYEPFTGTMTEDAPLAPPGFLGASKFAAEVVARPYRNAFKLSVLRLFAPYGPGQTDRLIPNLIDRIRNGVEIDVGTDGGGMRLALTHVDDVCKVIATSLEQSWTETINVASPDVLSIGDVARLLGAAMGREVLFNPVQPHTARVVPDLSRLAGRYDLATMKRFEACVAEVVAGA